MSSIDASQLGHIKSHDPREVWANEALQFTPWLAEHIEELNKAIGVEIQLSGREVKVGPFAVDLFGVEVQTGHPAIIENQLENTDHSHLGQILTYAAGLKAGVIVWIARKFRDEHREALTWLNEISTEGVNFFGVEVEILEIGGQYAPNFKLAVEPNLWQKATIIATKQGGAVSERNLAYQAFFAEMLEELKSKSPGVTTASKTQPASWFWFSAGKFGFTFSWAFVTGQRFRVELSIDTVDRDANLEIVNLLKLQESTIRDELGTDLNWDIAENRRQMRLEVYAPSEITIDSPPEELAKLKAWAVPMMIKFVSVMRPRVKALP